jgi:hypothetical protein
MSYAKCKLWFKKAIRMVMGYQPTLLPFWRRFSNIKELLQRYITMISIYEGSCLFVLFCLYLWDPSNRDASDHVFGLFGKLPRRMGASAWWRLDLQCKSAWILNNFFTEN